MEGYGEERGGTHGYKPGAIWEWDGGGHRYKIMEIMGGRRGRSGGCGCKTGGYRERTEGT